MIKVNKTEHDNNKQKQTKTKTKIIACSDTISIANELHKVCVACRFTFKPNSTHLTYAISMLTTEFSSMLLYVHRDHIKVC